ncbi:MAG: aquaporin family protein [Hyphomicrobiaceae bacterium]|nr:aquaporin family protein [Hyphomicrobiaceae bacterium]
MTFSFSRRLFAEFAGTGFLVGTVVGSGIMAETLTNDVALALLGNTIPTGAILFVLITIFGPVSSAHFNPAVSLVMAIDKRLPWGELLPYVIAQILGGLAGTFAAHMMFAMDVVQFSAHARTGMAQWLAEIVASFGLLITILFGVKFREQSVAMLVGLYITAAYWFTASTSFANPAVTIARAFTDTFSGIRPMDAPMFILMQLLGGAAALLVFRWMISSEPKK